jgi:hypothetical protein
MDYTVVSSHAQAEKYATEIYRNLVGRYIRASDFVVHTEKGPVLYTSDSPLLVRVLMTPQNVVLDWQGQFLDVTFLVEVVERDEGLNYHVRASKYHAEPAVTVVSKTFRLKYQRPGYAYAEA